MQNEKANFLSNLFLYENISWNKKIMRLLLFYLENTQVLNEDIE